MGGVVECAEGGRRWKKIWGSPVGVQRGEEKKKCPEAKVRCRPCESEWRVSGEGGTSAGIEFRMSHLLRIFHIRRLTLDGRGGRINFPVQTCLNPLIALTRRVFLSVYSVAVFS